MMMQFLTLVQILSVITTLSYTDDSECKEPLLDGTLYRVIDNYFTASGSLNESHQPYEARLNGSGWCADEQGFNIFNPWLQIEFGTDVKINRITIMGAELDKTSSYISHFQLEYCNHNTCTSYIKTKIFAISNVSSATFNLNITANKIRVLPIEWVTTTPCIRMELYGCLEDPRCLDNEDLLTTEPNINMVSSLGTFIFNFESSVTLTTIVIDSDIVLQNVSFYTDTFYKDFNNTEVFNFSRVFTFWMPVLHVQTTLNITILNATYINSTSITFYGCNSSDAYDMLRPETRSSLVLPSPTSSLSPSASSQVLPSPISSLSLLTSSQSAIISPVTSVIVRTNYLVAIAGVPIAAITIIIVFVIILCGVSYICYIKIQNERKIQQLALPPDDNNTEVTLKTLQNKLYGQREDYDFHVVNPGTSMIDDSYDSGQRDARAYSSNMLEETTMTCSDTTVENDADSQKSKRAYSAPSRDIYKVKPEDRLTATYVSI